MKKISILKTGTFYKEKIKWNNLIAPRAEGSFLNGIFKNIPNESGVYIARTDTEFLYVGSSKMLHSRLTKHDILRPLHKQLGGKLIITYALTKDYLDIEKWLIKHTLPKHNKIHSYTQLKSIDELIEINRFVLDFFEVFPYNKQRHLKSTLMPF